MFLESMKGSNSNIDAGSFVGRGGPGGFYQKAKVPEDQVNYSWQFTRITEYKKGVAKYASSCPGGRWRPARADSNIAHPQPV